MTGFGGSRSVTSRVDSGRHVPETSSGGAMSQP